MKVKDVIKYAATFLNRENVVRYLEKEENFNGKNASEETEVITAGETAEEIAESQAEEIAGENAEDNACGCGCFFEESENTEDKNTLFAVDMLIRCANLVIDETCLSYIPLLKKETVQPINGKVEFSALSEKLLRLKKVTANGYPVRAEDMGGYITARYPSVEIEYEYLSPKLGLSDDTGYDEAVLPARILAYGVAAEFSLTERSFEESALWRKRFLDAIGSLVPPKNGKIKARSFI